MQSGYNLENGDLLPYITGQKYNKNLKELFKLMKINRMVTILDPKTRENKQVSIATIASSRMARRVFIGNLMNKENVKNEVIASMSGHVHNSKAFSRYYTVEKQSQIDAMKHIE